MNANGPEVRDPKSPPAGPFAVIGLAVTLAAAIFIGGQEGTEFRAYRDVVGIWTICTGHTGPDVQPGQTATPAQCQAVLATDLGKTQTGLAKCITSNVTPDQAVALLSLAFNAGVTAICRSTLVRKLNAGEPTPNWCGQFLRWDRAGGRQIRGLTKRRQAEYRLCMGDAR